MCPAYRCMDSFPHQRNQMPYTQHYYPSFEGFPFPPPVNVDPSKSPISYETWPYGGNYGCSIPAGCHGCCNHNHFPSYGGFRPPYPHFPSPSPFQCHGGYPSFPETYPVHYVPVTHYSADQPRFEYEKNHCCGCPNHSCNKKEDRHVKIEEHESEVKNKSTHSLVPVEFKNYPYPIVWIPPEDMKNREQRESTEPKLKHGDEYPPDMRAHENLKHLEHEPNVKRGWFPFDINNMGSLKHGGDRNKVQDQPNDDRNRAQDQPNVDKNQFQFPIFWLPYKHEEDETMGNKEAKADHESAERSSPNLKVPSAQLPSSKVGLKATENNVNGKTNDVKQQEELHNKGKTEEGEGKARGITVKEIKHSGEKKASDDGTKRQSPSPRKTSKLPPVCLRVDPLPKRKNSHGDSRSPSPSHEEKAQEAFGDRSKSTSSINESAEVEPNKGKIKVVKVVDGITKQDTGEDCKAQTPVGAPVNLFPKSGEDVLMNQDTSKVVICDDVREDKEVKAPDATVESHLGDGESQTEDDEGANKAENETPKEEDKAKRKNLSEAEATVIIQSAYRGFEVRKWEPLKKLKQILLK